MKERKVKIKELIKDIPSLQIEGNLEEEIRGISHSSQNINSGYLFAALRGTRADGLSFLAEALSRGAAAVLCERPRPAGVDKTWIQAPDAREALALISANFFGNPSKKMKVIGITGTKGKTTITYLLEKILKSAHFLPGVIGTISYRGPEGEISAERTTPEAPDLQRMMSEFLEQGATHCLLEVSSHALELKRVLGIDFDIAVFTNLSGEHLDYHHSMENYYEAKKKLFYLAGKKTIGVINIDDSWGKRLASELRLGKITYGFDEKAIVRGKNATLTEQGLKLSIIYPGGELHLSSSLLGKPNLYNILAATAVALTLKISPQEIKEGLSSLKGVPGRFEKVENTHGLNIFVDYAHTDDALKHLLETTRALAQDKRVILVFGAGGDRDRAKRARMGEVAGRLADWTILTSDNPRSEDPLAIISGIEKGIKPLTSSYKIEPDRREAIKIALKLAKKGDYVLVAGKGHERYQILKDRVIPFNDVEVIKGLLERREE